MSNHDTALSAEEIVRGRIEAIKARCEAATPGPWKCWHKDMDFGGSVKFTIGDAAVVREDNQRNIGPIFVKEDADFIAASREDIPYLLALIESQVAEIAELQGQLGAATKEIEQRNLAGDFVYVIGKYKSSQGDNARLKGENRKLRKELTASQQETRAAVADLKEACAGTCGFCLYSQYHPLTGSRPGKDCPGNKNDCNGECENFKWRGPQKAGEEIR